MTVCAGKDKRIMDKEKDRALEVRVCDALIKKGLKLATAESCTGGLLAQKITSVAGASECFDCGTVTYSNEQKVRMLGVSETTLKKFGAVSEETALEMCRGIKKAANADFGIGITGIAGPGGGTADKPVGLVYIGICGENVHRAYKCNFVGDRCAVREAAANKALTLVLDATEKI